MNSGNTPVFDTAASFEAWYAANSKVTVEQLHAWGRYAERCEGFCDGDDCTGWIMVNQWDEALFEEETREITRSHDRS